jgi:hypothetical protein
MKALYAVLILTLLPISPKAETVRVHEIDTTYDWGLFDAGPGMDTIGQVLKIDTIWHTFHFPPKTMHELAMETAKCVGAPHRKLVPWKGKTFSNQPIVDTVIVHDTVYVNGCQHRYADEMVTTQAILRHGGYDYIDDTLWVVGGADGQMMPDRVHPGCIVYDERPQQHWTGNSRCIYCGKGRKVKR